MFSGIVETIGKIIDIQMQQGCKVFTIQAATLLTDLVIGESIAVNGVCLTITQFNEHSLKVTAVPETLRLTNLNFLEMTHYVNLERSITPSTRIGGHYVQGHVDCIGEILAIQQDTSNALLVKISLPQTYSTYLINKGFIALDGMSITIIDAAKDYFTVTFIPHTQQVTITKNYTVGSLINIEVDMMGKYIEKLLKVHTHANTV